MIGGNAGESQEVRNLPLPLSSKRLRKAIVPIVVLCYMVLALLHSLWVPGGSTGYQNAPDEAAHISYIMTLRSGHLPDRIDAGRDTSGRSYEWHQPPLYYIWEVPFSFLGLHGMRIGSILLGLGCLMVLYRAVSLLLPELPMVAVGALGFAALLPTHIAITSTVNNDVLLELEYSIVLFLLIACFMKGLTTFHAGLIGLVLGLALLTKLTALLLIVVIFFSLLLMLMLGEPPHKVISSGCLIFGLAFVVSGWWFIRNVALYGEYIPIRTFNEAFSGTAQARPLIEKVGWATYSQVVAIDSFKSFWAVFGNVKSSRLGIPLFLPDQLYILLGGLTLFALGGLVRLHLQRKQLLRAPQIAAIQMMFLAVALVSASFATFLARFYQTQGRYLFPAMLPIGLMYTLGWWHIVPKKYRNLIIYASLLFVGICSLLWITYVQATTEP